MNKILSAVSCNLDANILSACLPLFEAGKIEAVEWSFDSLYNRTEIPDWFTELLQVFGNEQRLVGHGVYFSLFSGRWTKEQQEWLDELRRLASVFRFNHISEHFGFMTGRDFHKGAPLGIPFAPSTLALGRDRLHRIFEACRCPVGLENLAFAYSIDEMKKHGEFLDALLSPVNGFLILDLHNLYCQSHNFNVPVEELLKFYPLHRVREMHVSGGSWEAFDSAPQQKIRRDTHDDSVPEEIFRHLPQTTAACPNLKFIVLEQLGSGLETEEKRTAFRNDFLRLHAFCETANKNRFNAVMNDFLPKGSIALGSPAEDLELHEQQTILSDILEMAADYEEGFERLKESALAKTSWGVENWQPHMLATAIAIAQKWKNGFE